MGCAASSSTTEERLERRAAALNARREAASQQKKEIELVKQRVHDRVDGLEHLTDDEKSQLFKIELKREFDRAFEGKTSRLTSVADPLDPLHLSKYRQLTSPDPDDASDDEYPPVQMGSFSPRVETSFLQPAAVGGISPQSPCSISVPLQLSSPSSPPAVIPATQAARDAWDEDDRAEGGELDEDEMAMLQSHNLRAAAGSLAQLLAPHLQCTPAISSDTALSPTTMDVGEMFHLASTQPSSESSHRPGSQLAGPLLSPPMSASSPMQTAPFAFATFGTENNQSSSAISDGYHLPPLISGYLRAGTSFPVAEVGNDQSCSSLSTRSILKRAGKANVCDASMSTVHRSVKFRVEE